MGLDWCNCRANFVSFTWVFEIADSLHLQLELCSAAEGQRRKTTVHQLTNILLPLEGEIHMVPVTYALFCQYFVIHVSAQGHI